MKKAILYLVIFVLSIWGTLAYTADDHDKHEQEKTEESHSEEEKDHDHGDGGKHDEKEEHAGHDEEEGHGHGEEEGGSNIGPDKGITEKADAGIRLSPEAYRTFGLQVQSASKGALKIPTPAIVSIKNEKTVYRLRSGWFKRVKIQILKTNSKTTEISSQSFRDDDQIVVEGVGFLRVAEIYAEEGASHSH